MYLPYLKRLVDLQSLNLKPKNDKALPQRYMGRLTALFNECLG